MAVIREFQNRFIELVEEMNVANRTVAAQQLGITYNTFSKIYNYGIIPQNKVLIQLADHFNVSLDFLLGKTDNERFVKSRAGENFACRLERLRRENGIKSVYALAQKLHIHQNNIGRWIKFGYLPELEDLEIIASFFDVSIDYLIGRTDDPDTIV